MINKNEILEKYIELNSSFKRSLVFHLGIDAGFFSEYNSMVYMILYCLEHKIQFKLYSDDANFSIKKGWQDYFEPFCIEVHERFHSRYNRHSAYTSYSKAFRVMIWKHDTSLIRWRLKSDMLTVLSKWKKVSNKGEPFDFYTHELLERIEIKNRYYSVPELGINGDYIHAYNVIFDLTWRFNNYTLKEVDNLIETLKLPDKFIACQIRGGDKFIEYDLLSTDLYINKIREISSLKDVFVLTDDYSIIMDLKKKAPEYNWYTLCQKEEQGYYNSAFAQISPDIKSIRMNRFFASMKIMEDASLFIGTITATPSLVIGIRRKLNVCWVDFDSDDFFDSIDYSIEEKKRMSEIFLQNENMKNG